MLLAPIPWAGRVWALPVLTTLAPSQRHAHAHGRRHKSLPERARPLLSLTARWLPGRQVIAVADSTYAVIDLLAAVRHRLTVITRLRFDARLFDPASPRPPGTRGRRRTVGARQPTLADRLADAGTAWQRVVVTGWYGHGERRLDIASGTAVWAQPGRQVPIRWVLLRDVAGDFDPQAFLCTDLDAAPCDIVRWFVRRWSIEVTFAEVRRHLGVETQRQWSDLAIQRTTPALLGLFSLVTLWANETFADRPSPPRRAAWYAKPQLTFSDALATVRQQIWQSAHFPISPDHREMAEIPQPLLDALVQAACSPA
jgi:hypothetical protein